MTIVVNQAMVDQIAGEDPWPLGIITFSLNVNPGNLIQEILDLLGLPSFSADVSTIPGTAVSGDFAAVLEAFELWDDLIVTSLNFLPGDSDADITVNNVTNLPSYASGLTYSTLDTVFPNDVDIFLDGSPITRGLAGFSTAVHEIGHGLGLSHPGDYNAGSTEPTYASDRDFDEDTAQFSIMSYFEASNYPGGGTWSQARVLTPMIYDILAIQKLYGADSTTRTGDTTYGFNASADVNRSVFRFEAGSKPVLTIWDAGGRDRIDVSGYAAAQLIDLSEGSYSNIAGLTQNFGIAFGTLIEDAVTGSGRDQLFGNGLANLLDAGLGNDFLYGGSGTDTLVGGANNPLDSSQTDNDFLYGGEGNDRLTGGFGADLIDGGAGSDTVVYNATSGETVTLKAAGTPDSGNWQVSGPAQASGDKLFGVEIFAFGEGGDTITVKDSADARVIQIDGLGGNDTIDGQGTAIDWYLLNGGFGTDTIRVDTSRFDAAGGFKAFGTTVWVESFADNDLLVIERTGLDIDWQFKLIGAVTSGQYFGDGGSTARGFNRIDYLGSNGADRVDGAQGDDTFIGVGGNDVFNGYTGQDLIEGGDGNDVLQGGDGNDTISGGAGQDDLYGGAGNDTISTDGGGEFRAYGDAGDDTLTGSNDAETLYGGDGVDTLRGFVGNDLLDAGIGNASVAGDDGNDRILAAGGVIQVYGGAGTDELTYSRSTLVSDVEFFLNRRIGSDGLITRSIELFRFTGGTGNERVDGGDLGSNFLNGFGGNDTLTGGVSLDNLQGGEGNDVLYGGAGRDDLYGGIGNDRIETGGGGDVNVLGEAGDDTLTGSDDSETMSGDANNDVIRGQGGNDLLYGGTGDDQLYGGDGNDRIITDLGADRVFGGLGIDDLTVDRRTTTAGATYILNTGKGSDGARAAEIEILRYLGGSGDDRVTGGDLGSNFLNGFGGNDTLTGGVSLDNLQGGEGNDVLYGGAGRDDLYGGLGNDRIETGGGIDINVLGEAGDDTVNGSADSETMSGGADQDVLSGFDGNDVLFGGDGADRLAGGGGNDQLTGDAGADVFVFAPGFGLDRIAEFDADPAGGSQDLIDVTGFGFGSFAGMLAAGVTIAAGVGSVITFAPGSAVLTLTGVAPTAIDATDFLF